MWKLIEESGLKYFQFEFDNKVFLYSTKSGIDRFLEKYQPITLKQIHSAIIVDIDNESKVYGDGLVTSKNKPIGVKIADCLPVYIFSNNKIAVLHCGWRSIIKGILTEAVNILNDYQYVLGAGIGPCCYEVKSDVARLYAGRYSESLIHRDDKIFLDLKKTVIKELGSKNLIADLDYCTKCTQEYFYSYRRGDRERNYAILMRV